MTVTLTITPDARALAKATLDGDATAACALVDWVLENRSGTRPIKQYVEQLEDTLIELRRLLAAGRRRAKAMEVDNTGLWLADFFEVEQIEAALWRCVTLARECGRTGPQ